jgi:fatty acid desaturase
MSIYSIRGSHLCLVKVTLAEIRTAVPKHLHQRSTPIAIYYAIRDVLFAYVVYKLGWMIDPFAQGLVEKYGVSPNTFAVVKWSLWAVYWYSQSICLAGWWCLAHEAGHGTLSDYNWVNHAIGFSLHTVSNENNQFLMSNSLDC